MIIRAKGHCTQTYRYVPAHSAVIITEVAKKDVPANSAERTIEVAQTKTFRPTPP